MTGSSDAVPLPSRNRDAMPLTMLGVTVAVSIVIVFCLAVVFWISFLEGAPDDPVRVYTIGNYGAVIADARTVGVVWNTLGFSLVSLVVALAFGIPIAWLVERCDLAGKAGVFTLMTIGLLMPGFATAMGWLFLLHPRIGLVNAWLMNHFALKQAPLNIATIPGMGWVQGLNLAPLAFIMTAAVFRAMDPSLEESAYMSGARPGSTMRAVTLPLAWPGILAAGIYIFTIGFAAFDVPAVIGLGNRILTFSTYLYLLTRPEDVFQRYGEAAALSTFIIALAGVLIWWYARMQRRSRQYAVVTGKAYRPRIVRLGRWAWLAWGFLALYFFLANLIPVMLVVWSSLLPYFQLPGKQAFALMGFQHYRALPWSLALNGLGNTAILMVLTPTLALAVSLCFSWVVLRSRVRWRSVFDFIAFLPHAVPNIVFGVGTLLLTLYVLQKFMPIYGTIGVLLFVFIIARISYATRMTNAGLIQIHGELEESAQISGAKTVSIFRFVLLPLLAPSLLYAWLWIALLTFRELTLSVILTTPRNMTLPVVVWTTWLGGGLAQASALVVVTLALMAPLMALFWFVAGRRGLLSVRGDV